MPYFRKKPVVIQAVQWTGVNLFEIVGFMEGQDPDIKHPMAAEAWDAYMEKVDRDGLIIKTLEGDLHASVGSWIVKGEQGEHYAVKPDVFDQSYEVVIEWVAP